MMRKLLLFLAAVVMVFSLSYAQDELREITTDGTASVLNNDKAMARDVAIQDALRNAVEQVTGAVISSSTVVENAMVVEDNIYSKAKGYVKAYSVLSEGEADNGLSYNVKVKAQVRAGAIKEDIGDILRGAGNPRLMVLITEQNIGQQQYSGLDVSLNVAENAIMENMRNKGFEFVDQETNERNMRKDKALAAMQGDAAAAAFIGDRAGAEVIITGKSFAKEASGVSDMLGGMKSMQATVSVKAINTDDGRVLVSKSQSDKTIHIDEVAGGTKAIEMAANKVADYLADEIVKKFTRGSNTVTLNVTGIADYQMYTDLVNILKYEIRGVKGVSEREVAGSTGLIEVDTKFNSGQLTSELLYKTFPNFRVRIISRTANKINLKLVARKQ
ncbi:MAG: flagellar assembly protein T N-terminal domain-containing protein [Candidatus Edwardsbacteria bacterium]|nr:flagellar assembly protein T N-terminal domain-containing protein [Candidatus Edwardsbacteria bacterium]